MQQQQPEQQRQLQLQEPMRVRDNSHALVEAAQATGPAAAPIAQHAMVPYAECEGYGQMQGGYEDSAEGGEVEHTCQICRKVFKREMNLHFHVRKPTRFCNDDLPLPFT